MLDTKNRQKDCVEIAGWFDDMVAQLRSDQVQIEAGVASSEKEDFYKPFLENDELSIASRSRDGGTILIIKKLVAEYIAGLHNRKAAPISLALQLTSSKILAWAVVKDDDEDTTDSLFLEEAFVNAKFSKYGMYISTTIMEESDNYPVPSQYKKVI